MAAKNNRRTIMTKMILRDSLLELMQTKPISKITIKEICDLSDMSRSTFYLHYQDPFALLADIEKEALEKTFENLRMLDTESNSISSIEIFLNYIKDNKTTFGILLCQRETHAFQQGIMNRVQSYIQSLLPELSDKSEEQYIYSFIMHGCLNIIVDWINNDFDIEAHKLSEIIFHICSHTMP